MVLTHDIKIKLRSVWTTLHLDLAVPFLPEATSASHILAQVLLQPVTLELLESLICDIVHDL